MSDTTDAWEQLRAPFVDQDVEWRVQMSGATQRGPWAIVVPYVTSRAIQDRLDEVFGPECWRNEFREGPAGGVICRIEVRYGNAWIGKEDGAENTDIEKVKGGLSGALKRAAVLWGIGRYLYRINDTQFATIKAHGKRHEVRGKGRYVDKIKDSGAFFAWDPPSISSPNSGNGGPPAGPPSNPTPPPQPPANKQPRKQSAASPIHQILTPVMSQFEASGEEVGAFLQERFGMSGRKLDHRASQGDQAALGSIHECVRWIQAGRPPVSQWRDPGPDTTKNKAA